MTRYLFIGGPWDGTWRELGDAPAVLFVPRTPTVRYHPNAHSYKRPEDHSYHLVPDLGAYVHEDLWREGLIPRERVIQAEQASREVRGAEPTEVIIDEVSSWPCEECGCWYTHRGTCSRSAMRDPSHPFNQEAQCE